MSIRNSTAVFFCPNRSSDRAWCWNGYTLPAAWGCAEQHPLGAANGLAVVELQIYMRYQHSVDVGILVKSDS